MARGRRVRLTKNLADEMAKVKRATLCRDSTLCDRFNISKDRLSSWQERGRGVLESGDYPRDKRGHPAPLPLTGKHTVQAYNNAICAYLVWRLSEAIGITKVEILTNVVEEAQKDARLGLRVLAKLDEDYRDEQQGGTTVNVTIDYSLLSLEDLAAFAEGRIGIEEIARASSNLKALPPPPGYDRTDGGY